MSEGELVEALAAMEHERWSHWQRHLHKQCKRQEDGSLLIPADLVVRWERQTDLAYEQLTDPEKESDREHVSKALPIIRKFCAGDSGDSTLNAPIASD